MKENNFVKYLDSKDIEAVVFDVDNTLLATSDYYYFHTTQLSKKLYKKVAKNQDLDEFIEIVDQFLNDLYIQRRYSQPVLIHIWYTDALNEYLNGNIPDELKDEVEEYFKDFYSIVPTPYEVAVDVLNTVVNSSRKIALHSHAQEDWTKMKAKYLSKLIDYDIPYLATPIDIEKDSRSWLKAFNLIKSNPKNTLVIGDSFRSDILPSIEAGSRYLTWIDRYEKELPKDFESRDDVELQIVKNLEELL
jgi:FMN phosphatase YigB (HAD superfamily)